ALPSMIPLKVKDRDGLFREMLDPRPATRSAQDGSFTLSLPQQWACDPTIVEWPVALPDDTICAGSVPDPPASSPFPIAQLKDRFGWGLVTGGEPVLVATGPAGPPAVIGPVNVIFNSNGSITETNTFTGQVTHTIFNP